MTTRFLNSIDASSGFRLSPTNIDHAYSLRKSRLNSAVTAYTPPLAWPNISTVYNNIPGTQKIAITYKISAATVWIPFSIKVAGAYTVDWGDGTTENFNANVTAEHYYTYSNTTLTDVGTYKLATVIITPQSGQSITLFSVHQRASIVTVTHNVPIVQLAISAPNLTTLNLASTGTSTQVITLTDLAVIQFEDLGQITNLNYTFLNCKSLESISLIVPSTVTQCEGTFMNCSSMQQLPSISIPNVTVTRNMFSGCTNVRGFNSTYDVGQVADASYMFQSCSSLRIFPKLNWNSIANAEGMYRNCSSLIKMPSITSLSLTNMNQMMEGCLSLEVVDRIYSANVTSSYLTFSNCYNLSSYPDLDLIRTKNTYMMFNNCQSILSVDKIANMNEVIDTSFMFSNCIGIREVSELSMGSTVKNATSMFSFCADMFSANIAFSSAASNVLAVRMFDRSDTLKTVTLSNTHVISNATRMFSDCTKLERLDGINFSNVKDASFAFNNCNLFSSLNFLDMSNCTNAESMFANNFCLTRFLGAKTPNLVSANSMFLNCESLWHIGNLDLGKVPRTNATSIFGNANSLCNVNLININCNINFDLCAFDSTEMYRIANNLVNITDGQARSITMRAAPSLPWGLYGPIPALDWRTGNVTDPATASNTAGSSGTLRAHSVWEFSANYVTTNTVARTSTALTKVDRFYNDSVVLSTSTDSADVRGAALNVGINVNVTTSNSTVTFSRTDFNSGANMITLANGTMVSFRANTNVGNLAANTIYYVVNSANATFQLSTSSGGNAITFSGANAANLSMRYVSKVTSWASLGSNNFSITLDNKLMSNANSITMSISNSARHIFTLKGWTRTNF